MRSARGLLLLTATILSAASCRSRGGIGRADGPVGLAFAARTFGARTSEDFDATRSTIVSAPAAFADSVGTSWRELRRTYRLYLDSTDTN